MSPFSWQDQNLCGLSLAFIKDWRVLPNHIQQVSNSSRFVFRENHMLLYQNTYYFFAGWLGIQKTSKKQQLSCFDVFNVSWKMWVNKCNP